MNNEINFKKISLEERLKKYEEIKLNNPDSIPIIFSLHSSSKNLKIDKIKYLIPRSYTVNHLIESIRKRATITSDNSIYVYYDNILLKNTEKVQEYYNLYKSEDNFLYLKIGELSSYGKI